MLPTEFNTVAEEDYRPNHFGISLACIIVIFLVCLLVSLNVVEVGLSIMEIIPWPS